MALTKCEERRIIQMINELSDTKRRAVTRSENSLLSWLKGAARWLWKKFTDTIIGNVINWLIGIF